jgi:hypothetical protein
LDQWPLVRGRSVSLGIKRALLVLGAVLGVYLAIRAVAEPFVIDVSDPPTYRNGLGHSWSEVSKPSE